MISLQKQLDKRQQFFAALASVLIILEYCIAYYLKTGFIRTVLGDVFVAMLLFSVIRAFSTIQPVRLGIFVCLFTLFVELSQWLQLVEFLGIPRNDYTTMVFGHAFDWRDLVAYTIGTSVVVLMDLKMKFYTRHKD